MDKSKGRDEGPQENTKQTVEVKRKKVTRVQRKCCSSSQRLAKCPILSNRTEARGFTRQCKLTDLLPIKVDFLQQRL